MVTSVSTALPSKTDGSRMEKAADCDRRPKKLQRSILQTIPTRPGVYRMFDENHALLYVGKAKDLKKRVSAYFNPGRLGVRIGMMMAHACHLEFTVTRSEAEALLLESNIIKHGKPRYNILLRDDKSYPHISVSCGDPYPRVSLHRGAQRQKDRYFGPYPNAHAARRTTHLLYKLFRLRQCTNSVFNNRSRPCLQYQIKQCSAPCVNYISPQDYAHDVDLAMEFLNGDSHRLIERLIAGMDQATQTLEYEKAARYRDQIQILREVPEQHYVGSANQGEIDIVACCNREATACVQVFSVRGGLHIGNRAYYPRLPGDDIDEGETLEAFIAQYYLRHPLPAEIILSHKPDNHEVLATALSEKAGRTVRLTYAVRGTRRQWLKSAVVNAEHALESRLMSKANQAEKMQSLTRLLGLDQQPRRLECFDVSHTMGEETVASCVVFTAQGPCKEAWRLFNIRHETGGDDYAALAQALRRHYSRINNQEQKQDSPKDQTLSPSTQNDKRHKSEVCPTVLFIDGGKGQLNVARRVLAELEIDDLMLVSIAKGEGRKAGRETLYRFKSSSPQAVTGGGPKVLDRAVTPALAMLSESSYQQDSDFFSDKSCDIEPIPVGEKERMGFYLILQIRDEAHRFAIRGHRSRRARKRRRSPLEDIPGLGAKRRHQLLRYFGGAQGIHRAGVEELSKVPGINHKLATAIYAALHDH